MHRRAIALRNVEDPSSSCSGMNSTNCGRRTVCPMRGPFRRGWRRSRCRERLTLLPSPQPAGRSAR
jgi:hypothetical protein